MKTDRLRPPQGIARLALAHHEGGHVAVAHFFQVRAVEVSLEWDRAAWTDGHVRYDARQMRGLDPTAQAIICLAGGEAQRKFDRRSWRGWHTEGDERDAYDAVGHLARSRAETEAFIGCLRESARSLLSMPHLWRSVKAVAAALLKQGTLRGKEVDRIIEASRYKRHRKHRTSQPSLSNQQVSSFKSKAHDVNSNIRPADPAIL